MIIGVVLTVVVIGIGLYIAMVAGHSIGALGSVSGSANVLGTGGLTITMSASGGRAVVTELIIYSGGSPIIPMPGTLPTGCSLQVFNSTGQYGTWGRQVIQPGQSVTINLVGTCGLGGATSVEVLYNNGKSVVIGVSG